VIERVAARSGQTATGFDAALLRRAG